MNLSERGDWGGMETTEQEYKDHIKSLEQQILLLKEQVDFLTRKLYGTKSEKTSTLQIEGQMSLFNEIEISEDPDAHVSDGELRETQTANYFSRYYPIDCAVPSANTQSW